MGNRTRRSSQKSGFDSKIAGALILGVSCIGIVCIAFWKYVDAQSKTNINIARISVGLFMILGGLAHFDSKKLAFYVHMVPPIFRRREDLVYLTGVTEAFGGLLMLFETTLTIGAYLTLANLIAVYPANIYCAVSRQCREKTGIPLAGAWFRLPLQFVFIGMTYICIAQQWL